MIVAVCYNEIMTLLPSSTSMDRFPPASLDALSFASPTVVTRSPFPHHRPADDHDSSTFSACLLVMDENFRLQEWISYAYFTLPLRYLVVTVDPKSKFLPTEKLDIFRSELNMTIIEWEGEQKRVNCCLPRTNNAVLLLKKKRCIVSFYVFLNRTTMSFAYRQ